MARPKPNSAAVQAAALSASERVLLFCVASGTDWERAGITGTMVTATVIRGLIAREPTGGLYLTKEGRTVLATLLGQEHE
jgi:hypothetical protein